MFNKILAVVLLSASLYSANVINSNVYTKSSSVEVHFSLDDPFVGSGDFTKKNKITFIHIPSIFIKNPKEILKESDLIMFLRVFPTDEGMLIKIKEKAGIVIDISKSNDLYTLKVVISKKSSSRYQLGKYKVDDKELGSDVVDMEKNYYIVAMFIGVMILLWILGKLFGKNSSKSFFIRSGNEKIPVKMEVQKVIDNNNKIVLLTIANMNYLVLVGSNNNTLLDKFKTGKKNLKTRGFDSKIRKNTNKIDSLIK